MASTDTKNTPGKVYRQLRRQTEALNAGRVQTWIDEAIASGPATPLAKREMDAIFKRTVKRKSA